MCDVCVMLCVQASVALSIPPGRTSSIFFVMGSGGPQYTRTVALAFYNNALQLPAGLRYVDDLATAQGGWES